MHYFNYAGLSPTRAEALERVQEVAEEFRTRLFCQSGIAWYRTQVENSRRLVAQLLQAHLGEGDDSLAFVPNATTACTLALSTLELQRGDLVITSDQEHPSTRQAHSTLKQRGIEVLIIPACSEESFLAHLEEACKDRRTKLITISHVAHTDGRIFPVQQVGTISAKRNVMLVIDGAQAVGHIPVDLRTLDVDMYFFSGHKWCAGPMGTGALLMTKRFKDRQSRRKSGRSATEGTAEYVDLGTQNIGLIAGFAMACERTRQELPAMSGLARLRTLFKGHVSRAHDIECVEWNGPHAPGMISFRVTKEGIDATRLAEYLAATHDIAIKPTRDSESPQLLRASWSLSTTDHDVLFLAEKLIEALELLKHQVR
jgi:selenocysteine lyase/cysteine desulfurase